MRAAVAEPEDGVGAADHLAACVEIVVGVVGERREEEVLAVVGQQQIVGDLGGRAALRGAPWRPRDFSAAGSYLGGSPSGNIMAKFDQRFAGPRNGLVPGFRQQARAERGIAHDRERSAKGCAGSHDRPGTA